MFLGGGVLKHRRHWGAKLSSHNGLANGKANGTAWLEASLLAEADGKAKDKTPTPVLIEVGAGRDHLVFEMEFSCEQGRLRIGNGVFEVWESGESPYAEKFRSLKQTAEAFEGPTGYFANMMADAAACAKDSGRQPKSSAADGLKVIEYLNSVKPWRR
jgi:hypothetical protein